jgi:isopentenyl-diphosphate delta-isomerase
MERWYKSILCEDCSVARKIAGIGLEDRPAQRLVCVDDYGRETGRVVDRKTAHTNPGIKHLAIQILVFNSGGEMVLHVRAMTKVGGGVLDAPTTHVWPGETPTQAAERCLRDEYGITDRLKIKILGGFAYYNDYGDGSCENEFCLAAFTVYDGGIIPNRDDAVRIVRLPVKEVVQELVTRPELFPVWLKETVTIVKKDFEGRRLFL